MTAMPTMAAPAMTTMAAPMTTMAAPTMAAMPTMAAPAMTTMAAPMPTMAAPTMSAMPTMAAPAMTTMAAPMTAAMPAMPAMTTMAAPTIATYGQRMGSFVGAPMQAAMPAMTTMAAPTMTAMPAMPSYGGGSFVAAPPIPAMPAMERPRSLTAGMPDPASIEHQKHQYSRAIDAELQKEAQQVQARAQQQKQMLMKRSPQEKAQTYVTIDQYATYGNMYVDDQTLAEVAYLQAESAQHRQVLEQQASALALEYNQRKAQEDMMMRQYQIQRQYYDNSQKLHVMQSEVQRGVIPQGLFGGSMAQPGTVLYDSAKQGAGMVPGASMVTGATQRMTGMVPGQSMVAGGQQPLANVAANKVGNTLGPGMASNVITQGTSARYGIECDYPRH